MSTRQATARAPMREPAPEPAGDSRRRWATQATSQIDVDAPAEPFPGFQASPAAARPAPPPTERLSFSPTGLGAVPFAQQRAQQAMPARRPIALPTQGVKLAGLAVFAIAGLVALYVVLSAAANFIQVKADDMQYGRPRTTHLDAYVGHTGEQAGQPSHFLAMNLDRRIVLIELPGGDATQATTITGPYLFGENEDLTPVKLSSADVNNDGAPDLLLTVKNEQLVYINDKAKNSFHLMTPEERAKLPADAGTDGGAAPAAGGKP